MVCFVLVSIFTGGKCGGWGEGRGSWSTFCIAVFSVLYFVYNVAFLVAASCAVRGHCHWFRLRNESLGGTCYPGEFCTCQLCCTVRMLCSDQLPRWVFLPVSCVARFEDLPRTSHPGECYPHQLCCVVWRPCNAQSPRWISYLPVVLYCTKALQWPVT